jgi:hypothetical protein
MNISFFLVHNVNNQSWLKNKQTTLPLYQIKALECGPSVGIVVYETDT